MWMRSLRDGVLHVERVERELVVDRARHEHVVLSDAAGCLADVREDAAEVEVDLVFRRILVPRRAYPGIDRSANFRDLARQMCERDYGGPADFTELEYWHLLPSAAELFAQTPSERLPWSYETRLAGAFDVVCGVPNASTHLQGALETWSEEFFGDDTAPEALLALGARPLQRLMEVLGPSRTHEASCAGVRRMRETREPKTLLCRGIHMQWDALTANLHRVAEELARRGVTWEHAAQRDLPPALDRATMRPIEGPPTYSVAEWLSPEINLAALYDKSEDDVCVTLDSPRGLQLDLLRFLTSVEITRDLVPGARKDPIALEEARALGESMSMLIRADRYEHALRRSIT